MKSFYKGFIVCICCLGCHMLGAQIVNIEGSRLEQDSLGWQGSAGLNFSYTQNINKFFIIKAHTGLQYRVGKHIILSLNDLNLVFSSTQNFNFSGFQHLRYNYLVNNWYTAEGFNQWQFDRVQKVQFRYLTGIGQRFTVYKKTKGRVHIGTAAMYEHEEEGGSDIHHNDLRLSNYLSATYRPSDGFSGTFMMYYQPLVYRFSDYRVSTLLNLFFRYNKYISFTTGFSMAYDSNPVKDPKVVKLVFSVNQGLFLKF
ncbi:hypothetical protein BH09BAC1_BH09BAC1_26220 [soil metagenome]